MKNGMLKRVLSFIMALAMVLTLLPATSVAAASETRTIYLNAGGSSLWDQGSAWFDAWVWGSSQADAWYTFADKDADGIYSIDVPADATGMKILRKAPTQSSGNWDCWNQTNDLTIDKDNCYTITAWGNDTNVCTGKWSTITVAVAYYVAGESGLTGADWDPAMNRMSDADGDGEYEINFSGIKAGTYEFKIAVNGTWDVSWGVNNGNASVTVEENNSNVTVKFKPESRAITTVCTVEYKVTFNGTNVSSDGAAKVMLGTAYTANLTAAEGYNLPETVTVTVGGTEATGYTYADGTLTIPAALVTGDIVITAVGVAKPTKPEIITVYFQNNWKWTDVSVYYWGSTTGTNPGWPGVAMTRVETDADGNDIYSAEIPNDVTGFIFNGIKDDGSGSRDQSPNLSDPVTGVAYYMSWDNGNKCLTYSYTPPAATYTVTFNGTNVTSNGAASAKKGEVYTATLAAEEGYTLPETVGVTVGGTEITTHTFADGTLTIPADAVTGDIVITAVGVEEESDPTTITVYFRNDWNWTNVCAYYWGSTIGTNPGWPGNAMTKIDTVSTDYGDRDVYKAEIPADVTGLIFNGTKDDGSGSDQTPDIKTGIADGNAYYIYWGDEQNQYSTFDYTPPADDDEPDAPSDSTTYEATFHFANTLGWSAVNLYTWTDAGTHSGSWPGVALGTDANGFYSYTVKFEAETNNGLNFIFNNGGTQTIDLQLPASAFVDNKAEKWIVLTTADSGGKYSANILDNGNSIVISPVVDGTSVTFAYKNDSANAVYVAGTMNNWNGADDAMKMTKNEYGIWTLTLNNVTAGIHQYKFVVDGSWIIDPANGWVETESNGNQNSAFLISDYTKDSNKVTINIHYTRSDNNYEYWNASVWAAGWSRQYDFIPEDGGVVTTVVVDGRATQEVSFKIRKSVGSNLWVEEEAQVTVNLANIVSGTIDVYTGNGSTTQKLGDDVVYDNKISSIQLDYDKNTITIKTYAAVSDPETAFTLIHVGENGNEPVAVESITANGNTYTLTLGEENVLDLVTLYQYKILFGEQKNENYKEVKYDIGIDTVYASDKFAEEYTYTSIGTELGAAYSSGSTTFKVWAPTAEEVSVKLYATGSDNETGAASLGTHAMTRGDKGVWSVTVNGDLNGTYYTYAVTVDGEPAEAVDPYARTTGVNGKRGMVVDLNSTNPSGWAGDTNPNKISSYTDAVIYELHVRDFSIDASSGVTAANRGKYLAFTEEGTKTFGGATTGIDYLDDLGITHVHLLPVYDYGSVDETTCSNFNWGYDPVNYNVPEGSYSTNPYDGSVRVKEFKQMVQSLHEHDISVIMDVVYNHVYDASEFCFNQIVPGYFSRANSNTSGCGNDTASEREMVRKYIVESVLYWATEYHIDGFRFDLVGLLDVETINQIVAEVHKVRPDIIFYGEGWDMDGTNKEPGTEMAKQGNAWKTSGFAYFSDTMRNLLAGDNGKSTGFASGSTGREGEIVSNFMAKPWWTSNPQQVVQYASCHDNYTLVDKLIKSTGASGVTSNIIKMNNLAAAIYITSQGIPFIHAGEELLREKVNESGNRVENSYNASDYVNHIQWSDLEDETYAANSAYYKGLIAFRKAHPSMSMDSSSQIQANVYNQQASGNVVSFWIDSEEIAGEKVDSIYVIFNANSSSRTITLPAGDWDIYINGEKAGTEALDTVSGSVSVAGISAMVLVQEESTEEPKQTTSSVALPGSFNNWNTANYMSYGDSDDIVTTTITLPAGEYEFKIKNGDDWLGNSGTIEDTTTTTSATGWEMSKDVSDNCKLKASGGSYTFTFNTSTNMLVIEHDPNGGDLGDPDEYYLYGYINGADYATGFETGDYKFDENGKLTTTFTSDSYVVVKNGDSSETYWTDGYQGKVTSVTLYDTKKCTPTQDKWDKLLVPGGVKVTFTLTVNDDNTATLSYETDESSGVVDASGVQNGVTLHCWNWSFNEIKENMAAIAEQGYTAIQTSPVQVMKEATNLSDNSVGTHWWVYYQPVDFVITTDSGNALGTKSDLKSMIETAHSFGIQVIVDVVANHLGNQNGNDLSSSIPNYLREEEYWHDITTNISNWNDRENMTQYCMSGLPDLNTANEDVQGYVLGFLKECVDIGVDGFRFDAAKSIETPDDDSSFASYFWPTVINGAEEYAQTSYGKDLYIYGEVLDNPAINVSAYTKYMAITDNSWGNNLRGYITSGTASLAAGYHKAADASQLVIWAESHDTYADGSSSSVSEADINRTWALVAARADAMGLYLARPESMSQALGIASETGWANKEVKEANEFHNAFIGQSEVVSNEGNISYVERGTSGAVLVNVKGTAVSVSVAANALADGSYKDHITGNTFTVGNGKITGNIGSTGIAVIYSVETHDVTIEDTIGGKVEVSSKTPETGTTVTITATPDTGKAVDKVTVTNKDGKSVTVTDKGNGTYTYVQPDSDVTVAVTFKDVATSTDTTHTVTVEETTGGKVTVSTKTPETGTIVTITATPNTGKEVKKVTVTDENGKSVTVSDKGNGTYTYVQPDSDVTVKVTFKNKSGSPSTGDSSRIWLWSGIVLVSFLALAVLLMERRKKFKKM